MASFNLGDPEEFGTDLEVSALRICPVDLQFALANQQIKDDTLLQKFSGLIR